MTVQNPLSPKVVAAAAGAGAGATVATLLLWIIGAGVFGGGWSAEHVDNALAAVPLPLSGFVLLLVTVAGAAFPGYNVADPNRVTTKEAELVDAGALLPDAAADIIAPGE